MIRDILFLQRVVSLIICQWNFPTALYIELNNAVWFPDIFLNGDRPETEEKKEEFHLGGIKKCNFCILENRSGWRSMQGREYVDSGLEVPSTFRHILTGYL